MKTIQLEMSEKAFKAIKRALDVKGISGTMKPLDYAWLKVIEHITNPYTTVVTLQNKADQEYEA
jgi:hypothetical protein